MAKPSVTKVPNSIVTLEGLCTCRAFFNPPTIVFLTLVIFSVKAPILSVIPLIRPEIISLPICAIVETRPVSQETPLLKAFWIVVQILVTIGPMKAQILCHVEVISNHMADKIGPKTAHHNWK